jgi:hypothetical protein
VLASWVTSRGNARAARIQAEASAQTQQKSRSCETRRTAYLEFIEKAHITSEIHWRLGDVYAQLTDPGEQLDRIQRLRADLRDAFDPLSRCARVIALEGPWPFVEAAEEELGGACRWSPGSYWDMWEPHLLLDGGGAAASRLAAIPPRPAVICRVVLCGHPARHHMSQGSLRPPRTSK